MDSFTIQKDLHPLFAPFCNLQSAHTISRRLWREVRISTSVARSQAIPIARTNSTSVSDSSRASTLERICLNQFFSLLLLLAGDLPLKRSLKGIYDLQSKDLPMLRRDFHACAAPLCALTAPRSASPCPSHLSLTRSAPLHTARHAPSLVPAAVNSNILHAEDSVIAARHYSRGVGGHRGGSHERGLGLRGGHRKLLCLGHPLFLA